MMSYIPFLRKRCSSANSKWESQVEQDSGCSYHVLEVQKDWNTPTQQAMIPFPRSGHRMVCDGTYLYSLGGLVHSEQVRMMEVRAELYRFHILTQRWQKIPLSPPLKNLTASHAMVKLGRHLLVHGGTGIPFGREIDNDVYLVDVESGATQCVPCTYKDDAEEHKPIPAYGQSLTVVPGGDDEDAISGTARWRIYRMFGTIGTEYLTEVYCLHWPKAEWELVWSYTGPASLPSDMDLVPSRYRHSAFLMDNKEIWVLGGAPLLEGEPGFAAIDVFVLERNSWRRVHCDTSLLDPRLVQSGIPVFNSITRLGQHIYLVGGSDPLSGTPTPFSTVLCLSLNTLQWFPLSLRWRSAAYFCASCTGPCGDELYIFGGVSQPTKDYQRCNTMWRMHFPFHAVPRLSELAWRVCAVSWQNRHDPEMSTGSSSQLQRLCNWAYTYDTKDKNVDQLQEVIPQHGGGFKGKRRRSVQGREANNCRHLGLSKDDWLLLQRLPRNFRRRFGWPLTVAVASGEPTDGVPNDATDLDAG